MQEMQVWHLGWEDPLRKKMATHSSKLAWKKSHGQRSLVVYSQWGRKELDTTEQLNVHHPTLMWARAEVSHQGSPDWARARQMGWVKGSVPDFWAKLWAGHRHLKKPNPSMHPREFISDQRVQQTQTRSTPYCLFSCHQPLPTHVSFWEAHRL